MLAASSIQKKVEEYNAVLVQRYFDEEKRGLSLGCKDKIRYTLSEVLKHFKKSLDKVTKEEL